MNRSSARQPSHTALLIIDLQNDFVSGGALAVPEGNQIVPVVDHLLTLPFGIKLATKDWHPPNHASFASVHKKIPGETIIFNGYAQLLWPEHCVQHTKGAEFVPGWDTGKVEQIIYKGSDPDIDSYSAFFDNHRLHATGLADELKKHDVTDVYVVGLATDYCVKYSVIDALELGFTTYVITDGCRGVNLDKQDSEKALLEMQMKGARLLKSDEIKLMK